MLLERGIVMFLYIFLHHCSIIGTKTCIQLAIGYGAAEKATPAHSISSLMFVCLLSREPF